MRELIYTFLRLERRNKKICDFCSNPHGEDNKGVIMIKALKAFLSWEGRSN